MEAADSLTCTVKNPMSSKQKEKEEGDQIKFPRLSFHERCGKGVTITNLELVKKALCTSYAIALTNRPLKYDEPFTVEITRINPGVAGYLSFGVTEHSPEKISFPVVMEALRSGTWVVEITSGSLGQVFIKVNGQTVETFCNYNHLKCRNCLSLSVTESGLLKINTMWVNKVAGTNLPKHVYGFVDLSGGCEEVRIIRDARNEHPTALLPQDNDKSLQLKWQHHFGLERRLNEMAIENFSETANAVSQPIASQPVAPFKRQVQLNKALDSVDNSGEGQRVPLYKELQVQNDGLTSDPAYIIRGHARDLPTKESGEQVKRLQELLQQKIMALETAKRREEQAKAELKARNEELQSQVRTGEFWEVPRTDVTLNMQEFLGNGAWGYVVKGLYHGQEVAVKCLHGLLRNPESITTIRREIRIMAQIRHPNIVQLIAAVIDDQGDPLIVTELLDMTLRESYERKLLDNRGKLSVFRDVAAALNYLHRHHHGCIIHRDVSSSNVLLEEKHRNQWKAKLSDFGTAKLAREAKTTGPGAPVYTAPELRKDRAVPQTPKVDVYSYGILVCEVAVNQFPSIEEFPKMLQDVSWKWEETMPSLPDLIISCTEESPDSRPTMHDILQEFNTYAKNTAP